MKAFLYDGRQLQMKKMFAIVITTFSSLKKTLSALKIEIKHYPIRIFHI